MLATEKKSSPAKSNRCPSKEKPASTMSVGVSRGLAGSVHKYDAITVGMPANCKICIQRSMPKRDIYCICCIMSSEKLIREGSIFMLNPKYFSNLGK